MEAAAKRNGLTIDPGRIKRAIAQAARPVANFSPAEVGRGVIDAAAAWRALAGQGAASTYRLQTYNLEYGSGGGFLGREFLPGRVAFTVENQSGRPISLKWQASQPWAVPRPATSIVAPGRARRIEVTFDPATEPGLYTAILTGSVVGSTAPVAEALITVMVPVRLNEDGRCVVGGNLGPAQYRRYFVRVPAGAEKLTAGLSVPRSAGQSLGRARIHLIDPGGGEARVTDYAGLGPADTAVGDEVRTFVDDPKPGTWEVVVYSSATLSLYSRQQSDYQLQLEIEPGQTMADTGAVTRKWLCGAVPPDRRSRFLNMSIRNRENHKPAAGMFAVNGFLFEAMDGRVKVPVSVGEKGLQFTLVPFS